MCDPVDWSLCCICGDNGELRSTADGIESLSSQFIQYWKNDVLPFSATRITEEYVVGEDGVRHPDFSGSMTKHVAKYHHNCYIRYTPYNMNRKVTSLKNKTKKGRALESGPTLRMTTESSRSSSSLSHIDPICIICGENDDINNLHAAGAFHATKSKLNFDHVMKLTNSWREIAMSIGDDALASRLMIGDVGANSSFYHKRCSTNLYNRFAKKQNEDRRKVDADQVKAAAWDKVIAFMNETPSEEASTGFEIHDLENMYLDYLSTYGINIDSHITRFAENLVERAPTYEIIKHKGTRVFRIASVHEMFSKFLQSSQTWIESIRNVVQPIRDDVLKRKNTFSGKLNEKNQDEYISPFLLALTSMLIDGEVNIEGKCSQAALTVAGIVTFNTRKVKKGRRQSLCHRHHKKERETSVTIYVGLKIYSTVRSKTVIQALFELGICISYDRILSITKSLYEALRQSYAEYGIFLPANLKRGCFVVLVKDNIDKNASANLIQSHFHGTSLSLLQLLEFEDQGERFDISRFIDTAHDLKKLSPLPAEYTQPGKVSRSTDDFFAPLCSYNFSDLSSYPDVHSAKAEEYHWLDQFSTLGHPPKSWSQYHISERKIHPQSCEDVNSLLPLLREKVNTLDMQVHTMNLNIKAVNVLNPGQTPVDVSDCPVYALTKEAQYRFPERFRNYFPMFGGLHIEQCLLVTLGQFIEGSGLKDVLETCSLATIGVGAVVDVDQIKRARYCLQVTLCSLYKKLKDAVKNDESKLDPWQWLQERSCTSGMCYYWSMVMNLQIEILVFVRSIREGNFPLYVQSLRNLLKWFFALDHVHYARWLTVHVFDLISLPFTHPDVHHQMLKGFFTFAKTKRPFSRMAFDQVHEQNNKIIKGQGGASSLLNTQDDSALIRWETCGPEVARIVAEFEDLLENSSHSSTFLKHHEDNEKFRSRFSRDVDTVYHAIPCNPFELASLSALNNSQPFPIEVLDKLKQVLPTGEEQVKSFINDRLLMRKVAITGTIRKNCFALLKGESSKGTPINLSVAFMNKLRSAVEHRSSEADELFKGELYGVPFCFSVDGTDEMYHGTKSSIQERLPSCQPPVTNVSSPKAVVIEASPLLRKLSNVSVENFHEFAIVVYNNVIRSAKGFNRLDIVFDRYFEKSIKAQTRIGRGSAGTRILEINDDVPFPRNFLNSFLCNPENKNDLGLYLAMKLVSIHGDVGDTQLQICVTYNDTIISLPATVSDADFQISSTAEEADQKLIRHTLHCIKESFFDIHVQSIDCDVLILLLAYIARELETSNDPQFNVHFKLVTPNPRWYNIVSIIKHLGVDICKALPFFYAFTGCDTVSSFNGKGKCTFFDNWMKSKIKDDITRTFIRLGNMPDSIHTDDVYVLESLVKSVYFGGVKNIEDTGLDELRKIQFTSSISNDMKKIAPSSGALYMHSLRASHTAGFEWVESIHNVSIPDPSLRGYILKDGVFIPKWLIHSSSFMLTNFLQICKCKTAKCTSCKCAQLGIPCLPLCGCGKKCNRV